MRDLHPHNHAHYAARTHPPGTLAFAARASTRSAGPVYSVPMAGGPGNDLVYVEASDTFVQDRVISAAAGVEGDGVARVGAALEAAAYEEAVC